VLKKACSGGFHQESIVKIEANFRCEG